MLDFPLTASPPPYSTLPFPVFFWLTIARRIHVSAWILLSLDGPVFPSQPYGMAGLDHYFPHTMATIPHPLPVVTNVYAGFYLFLPLCSLWTLLHSSYRPGTPCPPMPDAFDIPSLHASPLYPPWRVGFLFLSSLLFIRCLMMGHHFTLSGTGPIA